MTPQGPYLDAGAPTDAEPWPDEIPAHVVDRIRAALAST